MSPSARNLAWTGRGGFRNLSLFSGNSLAFDGRGLVEGAGVWLNQPAAHEEAGLPLAQPVSVAASIQARWWGPAEASRAGPRTSGMATFGPLVASIVMRGEMVPPGLPPRSC
jgi:hypothetical protein